MGDRAIIPSSLRKRVLDLAHEGHTGIVKTKHRVRDSVWWPGIDKEIEHYIVNCEPCSIADKSKMVFLYLL